MSVRLTKTAIKKGVKTCRVCKKTKPIGEFIKNLNGKWMPNDCRECERERGKRNYDARNGHPRRNNVKNRTWRSKPVRPHKPDRCEVCKTIEDLICNDHCHITDLHRGWLCNKCNTILGFANDDPDRLRALAEYIEKFYRSEAVLDLLKAEEEENMIFYLPI